MNTIKNLGIALAATLTLSATAQEQATISTNTSAATPDTSRGKTVWSIGLSGVVVDDDGESFSNLFNVGDSWNFLPFPSRVHVEMAPNATWSFEGAVSYSQMMDGKIVNGNRLVGDHMFMAIDVNAKYHFIKAAEIFDPYGAAGLGFTFRGNLQNQTPTLNAGLGANVWFIPTFGLNLQSMVKLKMIGSSSSYLMHSLGLVYRFQ